MPVSIKRLQQVYSIDPHSPENNYWIAIPDSQQNELNLNIADNSTGVPGNLWVMHISIDPTKMERAAEIILEALHREDAPRVSIKFAGKQLAAKAPPSEQVALSFYEEEFDAQGKIAAFLNLIDNLLKINAIGQDPRAINSDPELIMKHFDSPLLDELGKPTRFNYRNEQYVVTEDGWYELIGGVGSFTNEGNVVLVKQSYYLGLPNSDKYNPGNKETDPFFKIRIKNESVDNGSTNTERPEEKDDVVELEYIKFLEALKFLTSLENENSPLKARLEEMIAHIEYMKKSGSACVVTLTAALKATIDLCKDKSQLSLDSYQGLANTMRGKPSVAMQLLGGIMLTVGVAVATAAGLALAPFDFGATAIVAGSLTAALGLTFFAAGERKSGLCRAMSNVLDAKEEELENSCTI